MQIPLPSAALLSRYRLQGGEQGHYTDCFSVTFPGQASLEDFVTAFYTTPLFRCERFVLRLAGIRSADAHIAAMLDGERPGFAAWQIEDRAENQLLLTDLAGSTRSWFMVAPADAEATQLLFGSAVIARQPQGLPVSYRLFLGLHRVYSRLLLGAALRRLHARRAGAAA